MNGLSVDEKERALNSIFAEAVRTSGSVVEVSHADQVGRMNIALSQLGYWPELLLGFEDLSRFLTNSKVNYDPSIFDQAKPGYALLFSFALGSMAKATQELLNSDQSKTFIIIIPRRSLSDYSSMSDRNVSLVESFRVMIEFVFASSSRARFFVVDDLSGFEKIRTAQIKALCKFFL